MPKLHKNIAMYIKFTLEGITEFFVRFILWAIYRYYENTPPFMRVIQPEEVWLYKNPNIPSYVPSLMLWPVLLIVPFFSMFVICLFKPKCKKDIPNLFAGFSLALCLNGAVTSFIKVLVGRPRPDFVYRCFKNGVGSDFNKCTGDIDEIFDGRKSFPSGHSSFAFASMVFISLYLYQLLNPYKRSHLKGFSLTVTLIPLVIAASIAISRTCDYHHHYQDVVAGSMLGSTISFISYKIYMKKEQPVQVQKEDAEHTHLLRENVK